MSFKEISDKEEYLNENYPFGETPKLKDKKRCLHCGKEFEVGEFKVLVEESGDEFIVCPNAPECNGDVFDWEDVV